jgi:hypothetical protein
MREQGFHMLTMTDGNAGGKKPQVPDRSAIPAASAAQALIRLAARVLGSEQQVIGLPGGIGRPSPRWLGRGEILQAVRQDAQRLSERGDTVLEGEHPPVQGGLRFLVTPAGMRGHGTPPFRR